MRTLTDLAGLTTYAAVCPKGVSRYEPRSAARLHRRAGPRQRNRPPGLRRGRCGRGGGRGLLQHRHDRLPGDPHRSLLHGPDRGLHLPTHRQHRHDGGGSRADVRLGGDGGARRDLPRPADPARQLARRQRPAHLDGPSWRHRPGRRRYPRADPQHPRTRHAACGDRPLARRDVRPRHPRREGPSLERAGGPGPRQGRLLPAAVRLRRGPVVVARRLRQARTAEIRGGGRRLRREAQHPAGPDQHRRAGDGRARLDPPPRRSWPGSRTASSCPTAPATRRRPANTPSRRSAS